MLNYVITSIAIGVHGLVAVADVSTAQGWTRRTFGHSPWQQGEP